MKNKSVITAILLVVMGVSVASASSNDIFKTVFHMGKQEHKVATAAPKLTVPPDDTFQIL